VSIMGPWVMQCEHGRKKSLQLMAHAKHYLILSGSVPQYNTFTPVSGQCPHILWPKSPGRRIRTVHLTCHNLTASREDKAGQGRTGEGVLCFMADTGRLHFQLRGPEVLFAVLHHSAGRTASSTGIGSIGRCFSIRSSNRRGISCLYGQLRSFLTKVGGSFFVCGNSVMNTSEQRRVF
jgi:hypothetical protein